MSGGGRPGDAPDRPPPTQWWGAFSYNLPSDMSRSDKWDDFRVRGSLGRAGLTQARFFGTTLILSPTPSTIICRSVRISTRAY